MSKGAVKEETGMIRVILPDGTATDLASGATGADLAKKIKKQLAGLPVVLRRNGVLVDLGSPLADQDRAEVLTFEDPEGRDVFWHSSAHILAHAIKRLFPDAKPTIGPPIENGFFYDFDNLPITEEDFPKIEAEIKKIVNARITPKRVEYPDKAAALKVFGNNQYKKEIIDRNEETLSAYEQDDFIDLCTGPHIPSTGIVQAFKIMKTSGAYWRGDQQNPQLTRVYAISFPDKKNLSDYLHRLEEAKKRDHRVVGKKLDLFSFHEEAPGMPFFHPRGMVLWEELLKLERELFRRNDYIEVKTPIVLSRQLWETSGHWGYYRENMYALQIDEQDWSIKPMNCPGHMLWFRTGQFSYRQLPLRLAEFGNVHRHEMSGALSGLFRVRSFHQDDAHIFMKPEDVIDEVLGVLRFAEEIYGYFGLSYHLELSTRPEKSIGSDDQWERATKDLRGALEKGGYAFRVNEGDGAFYGPKIDIHIKDAIGRTWQCGTVQLDMALPERFELTYVDAEDRRVRPIMVHRAIYGSIERFMGVIIEHYAGRFPLWLSPLQVRVLTVADRHNEYAEQTAVKFRAAGLRADVDLSGESINKKVRNAQLDQVNYILVVGDQEIENNSVTVRTRQGAVLGPRSIDAVIPALLDEYNRRAPDALLV